MVLVEAYYFDGQLMHRSCPLIHTADPPSEEALALAKADLNRLDPRSCRTIVMVLVYRGLDGPTRV